MSDSIKPLILEAAREAATLRKKLHETPETAGCEFETAATIRRALAELSLEPLPPFLQTDVVAELTGRQPGSNVLLRADIDALPMPGGAKHACGHDGHSAMLWGAARVLSAIRERWTGRVLFVFQPGEEVRAMAAELIAAGLLDGFPPDGAYALHGWPGIAKNTVQTRAGAVMAAAGYFRFRLVGRGGHGSRPEAALNPLPAAAKLVDRLTGLADRLPAREKIVVTVCRVDGGTNENVIPEEALVEGTTRYLNQEDGRSIARALEEIAGTIGKETGVRTSLEYRTPYPPTCNDGAAVERVRASLRRLAPEIAWRESTEPSMTSEDFAYFLQQSPGAYFHLGMGESRPALHSPEFEFDDDVLSTGIALLVACVLSHVD